MIDGDDNDNDDDFDDDEERSMTNLHSLELTWTIWINIILAN